MVMYTIPEPQECFNCGSKCYARDWFDTTTTGRPYGPEGVAVVYWQCSGCGRRFTTSEYIENILIEVDELPKTRFPLKYIEIEEEVATVRC